MEGMIIHMLLLPAVIVAVRGVQQSVTAVNVTTIPGDGAAGCPSIELRDMARQNLRDQIQDILSLFGENQWMKVATYRFEQ